MHLILISGMGIHWERGAGQGEAMKNPCTHANMGDKRSTWRKAKQGEKDMMKVTCRPSKEATAPVAGINGQGRS